MGDISPIIVAAIAALPGLVGAVLVFINNRKESKAVKALEDLRSQLENSQKNNKMEKAMMYLLRDSIEDRYWTYIKLGYCPPEIKDEVEEVYQIYADLGGNGTGKRHYLELMSLPTECDDCTRLKTEYLLGTSRQQTKD